MTARSTTRPVQAWHATVLAAHLARLAAARDGAPAAPGDGIGGLEEEARTAIDGPTALDVLVLGFGLSAFERDVVLATVAAHLDPTTRRPTVEWALASLAGGDIGAFRPDGALRRARLVVLDDGPMAAAAMHTDARVAWHLQGFDPIDERLEAYVQRADPAPGPLPQSRRLAAAMLARRWAHGAGRMAGRVAIHGPGQADRRDVVAAAAEIALRPLWSVRAADLPKGAVERDGFARLWHREEVLTRAALLIEIDADAAPDVAETVAALLARLRGAVAVSTAVAGGFDIDATLSVPRPDRDEQRDLWAGVLPGRKNSRMAAADELSRRYDLDHADILDGPDVLDGPSCVDGRTLLEGTAAVADQRSRRIVRSRLDPLAERIEPRAGWDDLVLAPAQMRLLRHFAMAAIGRWKIPERGYGRDNGLTALFAGPSGTGKTLAAEVLAHEMGLDLYRIDLPATVSKWIGETEKHLRRLFDAAEQGGVVLLFDEADALFGHRSEVRDSHDRYANLEVSYLLQRMEQYRGVAILTTNMRSAIDPAFMRRLRLVVQFGHPNAEDRARLWQRSIPVELDGEHLDRDRLVRLDLTGGQIRTVAEQATLAALGDGGVLTMEHLRDAVAVEFAKHDRPLAELESWP